jgi:hypothetical protein
VNRRRKGTSASVIQRRAKLNVHANESSASVEKWLPAGSQSSGMMFIDLES